jgi:hypothetical protein
MGKDDNWILPPAFGSTRIVKLLPYDNGLIAERRWLRYTYNKKVSVILSWIYSAKHLFSLLFQNYKTHLFRDIFWSLLKSTKRPKLIVFWFSKNVFVRIQNSVKRAFVQRFFRQIFWQILMQRLKVAAARVWVQINAQ